MIVVKCQSCGQHFSEGSENAQYILKDGACARCLGKSLTHPPPPPVVGQVARINRLDITSLFPCDARGVCDIDPSIVDAFRVLDEHYHGRTEAVENRAAFGLDDTPLVRSLVLLLGGTLIFASLLFPPWEYMVSMGQAPVRNRPVTTLCLSRRHPKRKKTTVME